jgi:hypothetical protein
MMSNCPGPGRTTIFDHHASNLDAHSVGHTVRLSRPGEYRATSSVPHNRPDRTNRRFNYHCPWHICDVVSSESASSQGDSPLLP